MRKNRSKLQSYNNIFIIGMPASHKSTFCRTYSYFSGKNFLDFEDFFEKSLRTTISKAFQSHGLQGLRSLESQILHTLSDKKNTIIGIDLGTILSAENFAFAQQHGLIVFLTGLSIEQLSKCIWNDKTLSKKRVHPLFTKCANIEQVTHKLTGLNHEYAQIYEKADVILNQNLNSTDNLILALILAEQNFDKQSRTEIFSGKMLNEKAGSAHESIKVWNNKGEFYGKKIKPTKKITIAE